MEGGLENPSVTGFYSRSIYYTRWCVFADSQVLGLMIGVEIAPFIHALPSIIPMTAVQIDPKWLF